MGETPDLRLSCPGFPDPDSPGMRLSKAADEKWSADVADYEKSLQRRYDSAQDINTKHQILDEANQLGVAKAAYDLGKSAISSILDIFEYNKKLGCDPNTQKALWNQLWNHLLHPPEYKEEPLSTTIGDLLSALVGKVKREWADTDAEQSPVKRAILVGSFGTKNAAEALLVTAGPGEAKAAAEAAEGAALAGRIAKLREEAAILNGVRQPCKTIVMDEILAEQATKAAELAKAEEAARAIDAGADAAGMTPRGAAATRDIALKKNVCIKMRPTNKASLKLIKEGHPPKPWWLKMNTINEEDILLGAPKGANGQVGFFKAREPSKALEATDKPLYDRLMKRFESRRQEYTTYQNKIEDLTAEGKIVVRDDVVVDTKTGMGFTGDPDIFDITGPSGEPLSAAKKNEVVEAMMRDPDVRAQHPDHMSWDPKSDADKTIDQRVINKHRPTAEGGGGEQLVDFNSDGTVTQSYGPASRTSPTP